MRAPEGSLNVKERRLAREEAFRLVFQADQGVISFADVLAAEASETELAPATWLWARELARGAWERRRDVDPQIDKLAIGWSLERMASADRALLRLAAYEVLYRDDIPVGVSINDAVELAKRYGTDESPRFINGILGNLARGASAANDAWRVPPPAEPVAVELPADAVEIVSPPSPEAES